MVNVLTGLGIGNLDIFLVGLSVLGIGMLGFVAYKNNPESITNQNFLAAAVTVSIWSILNLIIFRVDTPFAAIWTLRTAVFFAIIHAFFAFQLFYVFPYDTLMFPRWYRYGLIPFVGLVALITLTPLVFTSVTGFSDSVAQVANGPLISLFGLTVVGLHVFGFILFLWKIYAADRKLRVPYFFIFVGATISYSLIITFNFVFPVLLDESKYAPFAGLFTFPYIILTAYAIIKHRLLRIKVIATEFLAAALSGVILLEVITSVNFSQLVFNITIFVLAVGLSYLLVNSVMHEIQQRERIQKLAQELERYNEQLSEFMSLATHEIRNPATFIKGFTAGALEGDLGELSPTIKDGMQKLYVRANDIIHLGNQYLNKSKLELNQLNFEFVPLDMRKLVEDLVHEFEPAAQQQGVTLQTTIDAAETYVVQADTGKMKEVVANLIDNSIKYTQKGSVTVALSKSDQSVKVQITDTGVGIPAEVIPKLFQKFSRADAQKANILGTGLGLYLAKIFMDSHHGTIGVKSEGKNKGSTFTIELPLTQPAKPATLSGA